MKSTGLFGKNSGRVGGVVYSTYRGEQVVRSYQPKVNNPNTPRQIEQRAKFKLVSQVSASLSREIKLSFVPSVANESPRNAFVKAMLKKTTYERNQASLPIEEIVLTNSRINAISNVEITPSGFTAKISNDFTANAKIHAVQIGYAPEGEIVILGGFDVELREEDGQLEVFDDGNFVHAPTYSNQRLLFFVYEPNANSSTIYEDYQVMQDNATLEDVLKLYSRNIRYSATFNGLIPRNV